MRRPYSRSRKEINFKNWKEAPPTSTKREWTCLQIEDRRPTKFHQWKLTWTRPGNLLDSNFHNAPQSKEHIQNHTCTNLYNMAYYSKIPRTRGKRALVSFQNPRTTIESRLTWGSLTLQQERKHGRCPTWKQSQTPLVNVNIFFWWTFAVYKRKYL